MHSVIFRMTALLTGFEILVSEFLIFKIFWDMLPCLLVVILMTIW